MLTAMDKLKQEKKEKKKEGEIKVVFIREV